MRKIITLLMAGAPAIVGMPAHAAKLTEVTMSVSVADLDPANPADMETLQQRIDRAAQESCTSETATVIRRIDADCVTAMKQGAAEKVSKWQEMALAS
jgi:UrcA family protein